MRYVALNLLALLTLTCSSGLACAQPDIPAVTKPFTVFVGDARGQVVTTPITYFGGIKQGDDVTRTFTLFGGMNQADGWTREVTIERGSCTDATQAPVITIQPSSTSLCPGDVGGQFEIGASGTGRITYLWQIEASPDNWDPLSSYPLLLGCGGTALLVGEGPSISLIVTRCDDQFTYAIRCIVSNSCGGSTSEVVTLTVCIGDHNCDGGIDGSDVEGFFADWEVGNVAADVNQDGGIDGSDVELFFERWEAGC